MVYECACVNVFRCVQGKRRALLSALYFLPLAMQWLAFTFSNALLLAIAKVRSEAAKGLTPLLPFRHTEPQVTSLPGFSVAR